MSLTIYGFHNLPHDFAVTKIDAPLEECAYLLDFDRPLQRIRSLFGWSNNWIGPTIGYGVPIVHMWQTKGEFVISLHRSDPFFGDIPRLWREHRNKPRSVREDKVSGFDIIASFGKHFPNDC